MGLTFTEARKHCKDPETSSDTATSPEATVRTNLLGRWYEVPEHYYENKAAQ